VALVFEIIGRLLYNFLQGANSYGQLCSGHHEDTLIPSQCSVEVKLIENIAEVTGGGGHTVLLTSENSLMMLLCC